MADAPRCAWCAGSAPLVSAEGTAIWSNCYRCPDCGQATRLDAQGQPHKVEPQLDVRDCGGGVVYDP